MRRDRKQLDRLDLVARVRQPLDVKIGLAVALYEAAQATLPGWPTDADRRADLERHVAMRGILRRVGDPRAR